MRNILSYNRSIPFEGKEILAWAHFQVENETSHAKQGRKILALYEATLAPERNYRVFSSFETFGKLGYPISLGKFHVRVIIRTPKL